MIDINKLIIMVAKVINGIEIIGFIDKVFM